MESKENLSVRNNCIDAWRLLASIVIVLFHSYHLDGVKCIFKDGKIWVEFFYFLTGFFTYAHVINGGFTVKSSFSYTLNKYLHFWTYTVPFTLVVYAVRCFFFEERGKFVQAVLEAFLIIKGGNVGQLWFLAALLPVLPLFIILSSRIKPHIMLIISFVAYVYYYFIYQFYPSHFPVFYLRAFVGIFSGAFVYFISVFIARRLKNKKTVQKMIMTVGNAVWLLVLFLGYKNILDFRVAVICFALSLSLVFGCRVDLKYKPIEFIGFIGRRFSFPIYVVHLPIADLIAFYSKNLYHFNDATQYYLYFMSCGLAVVILTFIADFNKKLVDKFCL